MPHGRLVVAVLVLVVEIVTHAVPVLEVVLVNREVDPAGLAVDADGPLVQQLPNDRGGCPDPRVELALLFVEIEVGPVAAVEGEGAEVQPAGVDALKLVRRWRRGRYRLVQATEASVVPSR